MVTDNKNRDRNHCGSAAIRKNDYSNYNHMLATNRTQQLLNERYPYHIKQEIKAGFGKFHNRKITQMSTTKQLIILQQ